MKRTGKKGEKERRERREELSGEKLREGREQEIFAKIDKISK